MPVRGTDEAGRGKGRAPVITDVAREAGVSISTVSRVLNDKDDVSDRTRAQVEAAIARMGFVPRVTAQRLVERRSRTLVLHFPWAYASASSYDLDFLVGAADSTRHGNHQFLLRTDELDPETFANLFKTGLVDGAILMQVTKDDWRIDLARENDVPIVLIGRPLEDDMGDISWIDIDFTSSIETLFDYLVSVGHEAIGFLARPERQRYAGLGSAIRLHKGFENSIARYGLEDFHMSTDLDPLSAGQAAVNLVENHPEITAIVMSHGYSTVGVIRALEASGRRVPHDVSVATIATPRTAEMITPPLTCVDFPSSLLGRQAALSLIRLLEDRSADRPARTEQILLSPTLTVRASTQPRNP